MVPVLCCSTRELKIRLEIESEDLLMKPAVSVEAEHSSRWHFYCRPNHRDDMLTGNTFLSANAWSHEFSDLLPLEMEPIQTSELIIPRKQFEALVQRLLSPPCTEVGMQSEGWDCTVGPCLPIKHTCSKHCMAVEKCTLPYKSWTERWGLDSILWLVIQRCYEGLFWLMENGHWKERKTTNNWRKKNPKICRKSLCTCSRLESLSINFSGEFSCVTETILKKRKEQKRCTLI